MHVVEAKNQTVLARPRLDRGDWFDLASVAAVTLLVVVAVLVGRRLNDGGEPILAGVPPLQGTWDPRIGVGTVLAPAVALLVVTWGVRWVKTARFSGLWPVTWAASAVWVLAVAWVDPWTRGVTSPLLSPFDYLIAVGRIQSWGDLTSHFIASIPSDTAQPWPAHVASHPPAALAPFVLLDRLGLGGPGPAAVLLLAVGTSTTVALLVASRALVGLDAARRLAPFVALAPGAIWIVTSADAMFMGVAAWGVALTAVACTTRGRRAAIAGFAAGVVLASSLYMSYGLMLILIVVAAVVMLRRAWVTAAWLGAGGFLVVAAVTASGFWWFDGYHAVVGRYYDGYGGQRPLSYWWWANLAAFALAVGPAAIVGLRRLRGSVAVLPWAAVAAVVAATLGGLSKAEVERIWLPFGAWMLFATIAIPASRTRVWLVAQAVLVVAMAHVLVAPW